ncbi:hypothetical protein ANCDUO_11162 [Ancylostoma duodenale]|uniref:Uncharacterized protein n=1 Tax=Ancylostoma duodenale TaxID=51022 RepID=A0A0C2D8X8_9BILA|nr:hypothetical protein ANCDUO_11162 [Ancylostoma duodenale]
MSGQVVSAVDLDAHALWFEPVRTEPNYLGTPKSSKKKHDPKKDKPMFVGGLPMAAIQGGQISPSPRNGTPQPPPLLHPPPIPPLISTTPPLMPSPAQILRSPDLPPVFTPSTTTTTTSSSSVSAPQPVNSTAPRIPMKQALAQLGQIVKELNEVNAL